MQQQSSHSDSQTHWNQGLGVSTLVHLLIIGSLSLFFEHQLGTRFPADSDVIQTTWAPPQKQLEPEALELIPVTKRKENASNSA
ncbi:MAG: hypothetical protein KDA74_14505, partial [Planctomycetaceae bacterium]|nr:hypothetical protein [Planctomycetaceae bacterium]